MHRDAEVLTCSEMHKSTSKPDRGEGEMRELAVLSSPDRKTTLGAPGLGQMVHTHATNIVITHKTRRHTEKATSVYTGTTDGSEQSRRCPYAHTR